MDTVQRSTRKSLPLTERDVRELAALRASASHRAALMDLSGVDLTEGSSEAAVLHAVWEAGLKAVLERLEDAGYAEMAAERDQDRHQRVARRRRPEWADEA
ncbi:MAG: hypothetical protein QM621_13860 [Aeromicrobium sp.]|uniref:hypothetical protein n=1 Tax=Aeromicrobium sp. TaxID=1871063 RepID=UPI0039E277FC